MRQMGRSDGVQAAYGMHDKLQGWDDKKAVLLQPAEINAFGRSEGTAGCGSNAAVPDQNT